MKVGQNVQFGWNDCALLITVCDNAKEHCPIFPGLPVREHWSFEDPAEAQGPEEFRLEIFRRVRDEIRDQVQKLVSRKICA